MYVRAHEKGRDPSKWFIVGNCVGRRSRELIWETMSRRCTVCVLRINNVAVLWNWFQIDLCGSRLYYICWYTLYTTCSDFVAGCYFLFICFFFLSHVKSMRGSIYARTLFSPARILPQLMKHTWRHLVRLLRVSCCFSLAANDVHKLVVV